LLASQPIAPLFAIGFTVLAALFSTLISDAVYAAGAAGKVTLVCGAVTAQMPGTPARLLGSKSAAFTGEVVTTGREAVLPFWR
jgi:hypothetical protein